ncbi:MAG: phospholipase D family protein [Candidatus Nitrosoglobus sp.]
MRLSRLHFLYMLTAMGAVPLLGCNQLPDLHSRSPSVVLQNTTDTRLGKSVLPLAQVHPGKSGVVPLRDGRDAFAARMLLADAAERTLDVQYYIWHNDMSGTLLFEAMHRAADRGVRVRLLLDDNNTTGLDTVLATLDAHPNIEVRLFNPFIHRRWRFVDYLTDFARLNRRMHNKSFTADNQVTIIGGRNVGDEYFDAAQDILFVDLDVLAIGPVVSDVSNDFDRYWASDSSYPANRVLPPASAAMISALVDAASFIKRDPNALAYIQALVRQPFVQALLAGRLPFEWAATHMISDDPAKGLGRAADGTLLWPRLKQILGRPIHELELVSPYFVPGAAGVELFAVLAKQGVKITVLTNSLEATDVAAVHAGYAKRRKPLLKAGIALFEMKRTSSGPPVRDRGLTGSSGSSLHAKTFSVDRSHIFIGSFNFDPRSARLNTEMGFVIDSPTLAQQIADAFVDSLPARAYKVRLSKAGVLQWVEQRDGNEIVHDKEPGVSFWQNLGVSILSRLPIEWLL